MWVFNANPANKPVRPYDGQLKRRRLQNPNGPNPRADGHRLGRTTLSPGFLARNAKDGKPRTNYCAGRRNAKGRACLHPHLGAQGVPRSTGSSSKGYSQGWGGPPTQTIEVETDRATDAGVRPWTPLVRLGRANLFRRWSKRGSTKPVGLDIDGSVRHGVTNNFRAGPSATTTSPPPPPPRGPNRQLAEFQGLLQLVGPDGRRHAPFWTVLKRQKRRADAPGRQQFRHTGDSDQRVRPAEEDPPLTLRSPRPPSSFFCSGSEHFFFANRTSWPCPFGGAGQNHAPPRGRYRGAVIRSDGIGRSRCEPSAEASRQTQRAPAPDVPRC